MQNHLNILHLEDDQLDADLIRETLASQGSVAQVQLVQTERAFRAALLAGNVDLVLSDYLLPGFNGLSALRIVQEMNPELPFVFVSGTTGEEIAIESLKSGATDYVLKEGLQRLGLSVKRALDEVKEKKRNHRKDEARDSESEVTERRTAAAEHRLLASLVESSQDAIIGKTLNGIITSWNQGATRLYGYLAEEVVGTSIAILAPPDHLDELTLILERLKRGDIIDGFETERVTKDGRPISVSLTISPIKDETGATTGWSTIARDITLRKRAEEALQSSELRYRRLFESAKDGILILNPDSGQIVDANPFILDMLGCPEEELLGKELWEIGVFKDIVASKLAFDELQARGYIRYDNLPLETQQGRIRQVEFVSNSYLAGGKRVIQCNVRDITERKLTEEDLLKTNQQLEKALAELLTKTHELGSMTQQLWQASKLATMGELAASIAHELNNPLATISLHVEVLIGPLAADDPIRGSLQVIEQEVSRMASLVSNLLLLSRRDHQQISTVSIVRELENSLEFMNYHLRSHNIIIATDFAEDLLWIHADTQQLRQVFLNLLTNGSDAMPDGGTLTVRAKRALNSSTPAVMIEFSDSGHGVEPKNLQKLFEPFFTTKPEGNGTGLGLPICRRVIEAHHGTINIESVLGSGTTVRIILPATEAGAIEE